MRTTFRPLVSPPPLLTRREQDVLHGLAQGLPNKALARWLGISESTVATHLKALFQKLKVHNRVQAVQKGAEMGWFTHFPTRRLAPGRKRPRLHAVASQKSPK